MPSILLVLTVAAATLRATMGWPGSGADNLVLTGILLLSLSPLFLIVLDVIVARGGSFGVAGVQIDFTNVLIPTEAVTIEANIGVPGHPIYESSPEEILKALSEADVSDIVVIDLESGQAWWETRLLVLCAGAVRRRHPNVIVFRATEGEVQQRFQGWARPELLLSHLLSWNQQYAQMYLDAQVAAAQWAVVTPPTPDSKPETAPPGANLLAQRGLYAFQNHKIKFEYATEQFLAIALGDLESSPAPISLHQLRTMFGAVLHLDAIDQTWPAERQTDQFLASEAPYVALTERGVYRGLIPRDMGQNSVLRAVVGRDRSAAQSATGGSSR